MHKIVVMADLHLVPEGKLSKEIDTADRLRRAIDHINAFHFDAAVCVLAGDLTDEGEADAYERLGEMLASLNPPVCLTLGNHDDAAVFTRTLGQQPSPETGCFDHVVDVDGARIVVLDSSQSGLIEGVLTQAQLQWLALRLSEAMDKSILVILHHPFVKLGVPLDFIRLRNGDALVDVLKSHPDVRHVICGHVHMSASGTYGGIPFTAFSGNHFNIAPRTGIPLVQVPKLDGPGQIAVVLIAESGVVVHLDNFLDRHAVQPAHIHPWNPECAPD